MNEQKLFKELIVGEKIQIWFFSSDKENPMNVFPKPFQQELNETKFSSEIVKIVEKNDTSRKMTVEFSDSRQVRCFIFSIDASIPFSVTYSKSGL